MRGWRMAWPERTFGQREQLERKAESGERAKMGDRTGEALSALLGAGTTLWTMRTLKGF